MRTVKTVVLSIVAIIVSGVIILGILLRLAFAPDVFMVLKIDNTYQVEFFTEYHDDPGIPVRAYLKERGNKTHEVTFLGNFQSLEENNYSFREFHKLGLVTVFKTKNPKIKRQTRLTTSKILNLFLVKHIVI